MRTCATFILVLLFLSGPTAAYLQDDQRPTQSRTSGRGWRICPSLRSSLGTRARRTSLRLGEKHLVVHLLAPFATIICVHCSILCSTLNRLTPLMQARVIWRLHVHHVHMLPKQLDDFIQLFVVAVAVHKDFKL